MYANYHTHTYLCRHAEGTPRQYVLSAIDAGMKELGFSDHVPYSFSTGHRSSFRMDESSTGGYVSQILALRREFAGRIRIYVGYEAEYYPAEIDAMLKNILSFECDYLILGQHFLNNEYDGVYSGAPTTDESVLAGYADQVCEALDTGLFSCVAHPDLINYVGDPAVYGRHMGRMCEHAAALGIPLEINMLGLRTHRHYPRRDFWRIAARVGARAVIGCDAHEADALSDGDTEAAARQLAEETGVKLTDKLRLRSL